MLTTLTRPVTISTEIEVLNEATEPTCSLAIWQRRVPFSAVRIRDSLTANVRARLAVVQIARQLPGILAGQGGVTPDAAGPLVEDVAMLAQVFAATLDIDEVELRLELVETDSCRKFHADYVRARLITTYVGAGTQWLTTSDAERVAAGEQPVWIQSLAAGHVGIFRGRLGPGEAAIHRSPPIAGTGERRLLLVLNPVDHESA